MAKQKLKKHEDPLKPYYKKIPKFYKDLGWEACWAYCHQKFTAKGSTAHWTLNYGDVKLVFWTEYHPRAEILHRVERLRKLTGVKYPRSFFELEVPSINKPWVSQRRRYFNVIY